jgi:hypothetical protein
MFVKENFLYIGLEKFEFSKQELTIEHHKIDNETLPNSFELKNYYIIFIMITLSIAFFLIYLLELLICYLLHLELLEHFLNRIFIISFLKSYIFILKILEKIIKPLVIIGVMTFSFLKF